MFHRKPVEVVDPVETVVWSCTSSSCIAWVRDNFKENDAVLCPLCASPMEKEIRMLPEVANPLKSE